jgi:phage terminase small subunit
MAKLSDKQKCFCDEYLVDLNATQAAIRAGYSENTARAIGSENLSKPYIQEYIAKRQKDREVRTEISQDNVVKELANIAFSNIADYVKVVEKEMRIEVEGKLVPVYDEDGNPAKYKTVEPILTDELTEDQKKALAVIQKGRDGFIIKTYDKLQALEKLGKHLGMWNNKENESTEMQDDGFMDALRSEVGETWAEE